MCPAALWCEGSGVLKEYRLGFDGPGFGLFLLIMLPNFLWFALPAPVDVLRQPSATPRLDQAASVVQVLLVAALCLVKNRRAQSIFKRPGTATGILLLYLGYLLAWVCYYQGVLHPLLLLAMCVLPCLALLLYATARKNWIAVVPAAVFLLLHTLFGLVNFLL